jgi:hypothetical protein
MQPVNYECSEMLKVLDYSSNTISAFAKCFRPVFACSNFKVQISCNLQPTFNWGSLGLLFKNVQSSNKDVTK